MLTKCNMRSDVYYVALTFIAPGASTNIDVDLTKVTAEGSAATWPKIASVTSYNPCPESGPSTISSEAYPSGALADNTCAPLASADLCTSATTSTAADSRVDIFIPLDLGDTFDPASHSVTLSLTVKDDSNNFQDFYVSIAPSNGFVTWCEAALQGTGAPIPSEVLNVDFYVGLEGTATTVTAGSTTDMTASSATTRMGSLVTLTAAAKGGDSIELEQFKIFWDVTGNLSPGYTVSYNPATGDGTLTATHSACLIDTVCKEATPTINSDLLHEYSTDDAAAKDFIQPGSKSTEADEILTTFLNTIKVASEGARYKSYIVDPTVGLTSAVDTVHVFALFKIIQGGTARRMLLQQAAPNTGSSDGAAGAAVHLGMTPAAFTAYTLDISPELVTSWRLQLQTSAADACLPVGQLMENVRDRLLLVVSAAASALRDVQIVSLDVNKAGVSCSASRPQPRRQLLSSLVSGPFVTVEALFIFDDAAAAKPSLNLAKLQDAPGLLSVLQIQSPSVSSAVDIVDVPASLDASTDAPSTPSPLASSASSPLYLVLAAAAGAALTVAALVAIGRLRSARGSTTEVLHLAKAIDPRSGGTMMRLHSDDSALNDTNVIWGPQPLETKPSLSNV